MDDDVKTDEKLVDDMRHALAVASAMRKAQKQYFRNRKQEDLVESKRLEAALDVRLADLARRME